MYGSSADGRRRVPKRPAPAVRAWLPSLRADVARRHLQIADEDLIRVAALLTLAGAPGTLDGTAAWTALKILLLTPHTRPERDTKNLTRLPGALDALPPDREAVLRLARAVSTFRAAVPGADPARETFRADALVSAILEVPDPEGYVRHLAGKGFDRLGAMFHPNTLARARKELRGLFGRFEGEEDWWRRQAAGRVRTVSDD